MQLPMRLCALAACLALSAPASAQDAYALRYRPQPQALRYRAFEANAVVVMRANEDPAVTRTEKGALELYRMKAAPDGQVELAVDTVNVTFSRDGVTASPPPQSPPRARITPRGYLRDASGAETVPSPLALILPADALPLGHPVFGVRGIAESTYTVTVEASPALPVRVPVQTKVAGLVMVGDRPCIRLETSARVSEHLAGDTRLYEYVLRGWYLFDPALGTVIESQVEERVDDAVLPVPKSGTVRKRRETVRTAHLEN